MTVNRNARHWKRGLKIGLGLLLAADAVLLLVVWQGSAAPAGQRQERVQLTRQHELLGAEVLHAEGVRERLPKIADQCDEFFAQRFLDIGGGYSAVVADFDAIARRAGLSPPALRLRQKEIEARGIVEVQVESVIEGDYASLVRFVNGLERSEKFYVLESLALDGTRGGRISLKLALKTYFRPEPRA